MKRAISLIMAIIMLAGTLLLPACGNTANTSTSITTQGGNDPVIPENIDKTATLYDLRVEDMVAPVGIDDETPVFSWKTNSAALGWKQSAYQLVVKKGDTVLWDSGKVKSSDSVGIVYDGEELEGSTEYTWDLTVFNKKDEEVRASSTFEMGLLGANAFIEADYISAERVALFSDTKYTIDFDFIINSDNQGFCFSMQDNGTFAMWQVNTFNGKNGDGKIWLRPHFKSGGNWTAYPGGPGNVQAIDVTSAIGYTAKEAVGKVIHERIEVDGRVVKTYFGKDASSLKLASTYTHSENLPLYNIGFRQNTDSTHDKEVASYGNIVIKNADGTTLYASDFTSGSVDFQGTGHIALENGMVKIGTTTAAGEFIAARVEGSGLPVFRKEITVKSGLTSAKLYTAGLGVYESYINGQRVGRKYADGSIEYHELKPGFTEMADRKFYSSYDVTWMLKEGANALTSIVSGGWWSDLVAANYGDDDAYLAKLILTYSDGSTEIIGTDKNWKAARVAPVIAADIFSGETYDARVGTEWMMPGFDDSEWAEAFVNYEFGGELVSWVGSYITVRKDLERKPAYVNVYEGVTGNNANAYGKVVVKNTYGDEKFTLSPGETALVDLGQNFAGWEFFKIEGAAGTTVTVTHGEILNDGNGAKNRGCDGPEGSIYNANYRSAAATTRYILSGKGVEEYHPSFTFYGFRYIEITTTAPVTIHQVRGQVVTSVEKETGFMTTSDKDVNQLISNIRWGMYSNYLSVPTDCPQRDERQGWTADTQVFAEAGCYMGFSKSFLEKFLVDLRDSQNSDGAYPGTAPTGEYGGAGWGGLGWADAGIIVPYNLYMMYGDTSVIYDMWESMQAYVDGYLSRTNKRGPGGNWGDWLAYESNDDTIKAMLGVAFYAWDALMMAEMAEVIGLPDEAARYRELYEVEKEYFIQQYVSTTGLLKRGEQTVCLYALYLDLLPDANSVTKVTNQLISNITRNGNKLQTGFLGTAIILPTLTKIGRSDLAYTLLLQHDNPSWLYSVDQGATTIWERWNSYTIDRGFGDVGMNSFNHYAYGSVAAWMFDAMAGIDFDKTNPGFKHIIIDPQPDTRLSVDASYESAYGTIKAKSSYEGKTWTYEFTLPANTDAEVRIPVTSADTTTVNGKALSALTLDTDGIKLVSCENGLAIFEAVAGSFVVTAQLAD